MPVGIRILAVAGSLRRESLNRRLLCHGVAALRQAGAHVDDVDLREFAVPPYDGDIEESTGLPPGVVAFKQRVAAAQGLLIASPEYNFSVPGTLKNVLDWASRGDDVFAGKVAALMAASPGGAGGLRMLPHLRQVLTALGVWLVPAQVTVPQAHQLLASDEAFQATPYAGQVTKLGRTLVAEAARRFPDRMAEPFAA